MKFKPKTCSLSLIKKLTSKLQNEIKIRFYVELTSMSNCTNEEEKIVNVII
jgi:hypothetical protein